MSTYTLQTTTSAEQLERNAESLFQAATIAGAMNAVYGLGRGDANRVDALATEGMRGVLALSPLEIVVVIGEGDLDEAPGFQLGERMAGTACGEGLPTIQMAVDPVDGTDLARKNQPGAVCVAAGALTGEGALWTAPEGYADKRCVGPEIARALGDLASSGETFRAGPYELDPRRPLLEQPLEGLILFASEVLGKEIVVEYLDRERNEDVARALARTGAIPRPIGAGDIASAVHAVSGDHNVDIAAGRGGGPEGVIAAAIAKCYGGLFEMRPWFAGTPEGARQRDQHIAAGLDPDALLGMEELAQGHVFFSCTALTEGFLPGVNFRDFSAMETTTLVGRSRTRTRYMVSGIHGGRPRPPGAVAQSV